MSSASPRSRPTVDTRRGNGLGRALAAGLAVSLLIHGVLLLAPPVRVDLPEHLSSSDRLTLVPPPEEPDPPPQVEVPAPPASVPRPAEPRVETGGRPVEAESEQPTFIPHDVPPRLMNPEDVQRYLRIFYPMALRAASVEGAVHLWIFVNESGRATKVQVRASSGSERFDELARSAVSLMKFRPALNRGRTVGVWVSLWVRFDLRDPSLEGDEARLAGDVSEDDG